jgi:hypothetical protein
MNKFFKKYEGKKYCRKCSIWVTIDKLHRGRNPVFGWYHNDCGQRVRERPRNTDIKEKYLEDVTYIE